MEIPTQPEQPPKKQPAKAQTGLLALGFAVVAALSFTAGTRAEEIPGYDRLFNNGVASTETDLDLTSVQRTYDVLRQKYDGQLDITKLIQGANRGMVEATGDPYTSYLDPEEAQAFGDDLEGRFSGIGAELGKQENNVFIVTVLDDSPAKKAGVLSGDIIAKVNDEDATDWSIDKAVTNIRGEKGTTVKLTLLRGSELKEISIVRDNIVNPSVKSEITADNIGVMRISRFGATETYQLAQAAAEDYRARGVKAVVVDLRGNGGGYLEAARSIAGLWLDNKVVVTERQDGKVVETLRTGPDPVLQNVPTIVLVDGGSASASEILAGALRDNGAAKIVGQKTFGKGSVQTVEELPNGGQLKVTVARWYTPNGININQEGIKPDIEVAITPEDITAGRDPQLDRAKQEAAR